MRRTLTLSLATIAAFVAGTAYAQDAPRGEMTRAQVERHSAEHFARMDLNGDGLLDRYDPALRALSDFVTDPSNAGGVWDAATYKCSEKK